MSNEGQMSAKGVGDIGNSRQPHPLGNELYLPTSGKRNITQV